MGQVSRDVSKMVEGVIEKDDLECLQEFFRDSGKTLRSPAWVGECLMDSVYYRSQRCFRWLLEQPDIFVGVGREWLAGAAGEAATKGATSYVRAIVETGADIALPEELTCHRHSEFTTLAEGAMISKKPAIVEMARDTGAFARSHRDCLAEAMEAAIRGRGRYLIPCLTILGQALLERFRADGEVFVPLRNLIQMIRMLQEGKGVTEESIGIGDRLEALLDPEETVRAELMVYVESRRPRKMWKLLRQLPKEKFIAMATEILPSVGLYASSHYNPHPDIEKDPQRGWRDVEKLLDLGAGVDGVDFSGRTILMNVLWRTKRREDLILRLVDLGADVNAISEERTWVPSEDGIGKHFSQSSVLDYCYDAENARNSYVPLLRSLGAKTIEELLEEREEGQ